MEGFQVKHLASYHGLLSILGRREGVDVVEDVGSLVD